MYVSNWVTLLHSWDLHGIVNPLWFNFLKNQKLMGGVNKFHICQAFGKAVPRGHFVSNTSTLLWSRGGGRQWIPGEPLSQPHRAVSPGEQGGDKPSKEGWEAIHIVAKGHLWQDQGGKALPQSGHSLEGLMLKLQYFGTWREELTHWKRPWCWERWGQEKGDHKGWDGWMASLTQWTWVWANPGSWWRTGKPGVLQFTGLQRVGNDWATDQQSD